MSKQLSILLVDDDEDYWTLIQALLKRATYASQVSMTWIDDGYKALQHLEKSLSQPGARPDLILLDERMPTMDGTQLLERTMMNPRLRSLQVCLMATTGDQSLIEVGLSLGARFCIEKPMEFEKLDEMLSRIIDFYSNVALLPRSI